MDDISTKDAMIDPMSQWQICAAYTTNKFISDVLRGRIKGEGERVVMMREFLRLREECATLMYPVVAYIAGVGVPSLIGTTCITGEWAPPRLLGKV